MDGPFLLPCGSSAQLLMTRQTALLITPFLLPCGSSAQLLMTRQTAPLITLFSCRVAALLSSASEHHYDEPQAVFPSERLDRARQSGTDSQTGPAVCPESRADRAGGESGLGHIESPHCSSRESIHRASAGETLLSGSSFICKTRRYIEEIRIL